MTSWSKLLIFSAACSVNRPAERWPMDHTCGKATNSIRIAASLIFVIRLRASLVIVARSQERAVSVWKQPSKGTRIG
jgi:hypothetical protein